METLQVGDFVVYKGMPSSPMMRICEMDKWGNAVVMAVDNSWKYCRTVECRQLEIH